MNITRLSGGLTPADGSDPRTFPTIFNDAADTVEAQGTAITGLQSDLGNAESDIDSLEADSIPTDVTSPSAGEKLVFDGTNWVNLEAYAFVETVTFTSNGTFSKGDYPWLRAIRVKVQAGGGGGGGNQGCDDLGEVCTATGGGGGGYGEKFYLESELSESISITVGSGGAGGAGGVDGSTGSGGSPGGASSFGSQTSNGGSGGGRGFESTSIQTLAGVEGGTADGDFQFAGVASSGAYSFGSDVAGPRTFGLSTAGGAGFFGGGGLGRRADTDANTQADGGDGISFGDGGGGAITGARNSSPITGANGGNGGPGIVIVELYA